jgi:hypothetical protein
MVETPDCACCGVVEASWHVVGECGHAKAVELRGDWAKRMWELVQAETSRRTSPLDMDVANHCNECGRWRKEGRLRTWQPGAKNTIPGIDNMDSTLKELLEGVARGAGRVVGVVDGSIYERVDGFTCSRRHGISLCA